jgi:glyoxylase-like metal-dependent hydrolase (beta-lactamase superfamily II)
VAVAVQDVAPGLWIWRTEHPAWRDGLDWPQTVTSTLVESRGDVAVLDPIAPDEADEAFWSWMDERQPITAVILKPDHVRDVDTFVERYGVRPFGPFWFWRVDIPEAELEGIQPGSELPGGLWLPEQRAIVFADGLTAPRGELLVWGTPWHEERTLPALRAMLELPFETVIVSHGEPVHDRAAFERALETSPWPG